MGSFAHTGLENCSSVCFNGCIRSSFTLGNSTQEDNSLMRLRCNVHNSSRFTNFLSSSSFLRSHFSPMRYPSLNHELGGPSCCGGYSTSISSYKAFTTSRKGTSLQYQSAASLVAISRSSASTSWLFKLLHAATSPIENQLLQ